MGEEIKKQRREKNKKSIIILCSILIILLLIGGGYFYYKNYYQKDDDTEEISSVKPNLKDDFHGNINFLNRANVLADAQAVVIQNEAKVITQIENDPNYKNDNYFTFFYLFDDEDERNKRGLDDLKPYFDEIDKASTLKDFSNVVVKVDYDLGVKSFINYEIIPNLYNNSKNVILIEPIAIEKLSTFLMEETLPSGLEFFSNDKYSTYKKAFEKARVKYFKEYGYDEEKATNLSKEISEFAKTIQAKSQSIDELNNNYIDYYKNISKKDLKAMVNNLPIDILLAKFNISDYEQFAILDEGHIKELDNYYKEEHLPLMKEILKLLILEDVASLYTTSNYQKIFANTYTALSGEMVSADQIGFYYEYIKVKPEMLGEYLNTKYDEEFFTKNEKKEITDLIDKIKSHYIETIKNTDWLDESTKKEAVSKLENLKINVGFTSKGNEKSTLQLVKKENGGSLISNYILINKNESAKLSKKIKEEQQLELSQFLANAYYNPMNNSINFLSGFREVYRGIDDKYEKYAYVGTIIGHEISHAFDNNGSQYDRKGNIKNWWSSDDKNDYETRKKKIADYYSKYEIYGMKIDGEKTVGENIADLAGVKVIISIMENEKATNDDYKKFFESYAKLWADSSSKKEIETMMLLDNHSPNKIRTNAVLSSMDKFYEVYDIKEGDKMFVSKDNRVGLW